MSEEFKEVVTVLSGLYMLNVVEPELGDALALFRVRRVVEA